MPRLIRLVALLLTALWLPATLHCRLESLGLDAIFACADHPTETAHTNGGDCTGDGCQTLESGQIVLSKPRIDFASLPAPACAWAHCFLQIALPAPAPEIFAAGQTEALPLQRTWQFEHRAAPPARAPDFVA